MKKILTDADRLELKAMLLDCYTAHYTLPMDELIQEYVKVFSDFYESKNTFSDGIKQERQEETEDPEFKGVAYEKEIDQEALKKGFYKVFEFLLNTTDWHTDPEISEKTGVYVPSVQRYRSYCRSIEWGGHIILRKRRAGMRTFEYRMIPNEKSKIYHFFKNHE